MKKAGRKWDPEFMELLPKCVHLDKVTGKLTFTNIYANLVLNFGWKGGVLPIPYSHIVWFITHGGQWPAVGNHIHHLNNDPIDNRPENLVEETECENQARRRGRLVYRSYGSGKYGYGMGIHLDKRDGRFYVDRHMSRGHALGKIRPDGRFRTKRINLGRYETLAEAESIVAAHIEQIKIKGLDFIPEWVQKKPKKRTLEILSKRNSVRRRRASGETIAEIAVNTGLRESNVYALVKDMGVDMRLAPRKRVKGRFQKHSSSASPNQGV